MDKILTFIVNEYNEILLLKGSKNDPQFKKSFWYVVTGGCEKCDLNREETVKREIKEETGINEIKDIMYLNWIFKYNSLGVECTEYAYITFVKKQKIKLNEENVDYKWCDIKEFTEKIHWYGNKQELYKVLKEAIDKKLVESNIVKPVVTDSLEIAKLIKDGWNSAYRGIISDTYLENMNIEKISKSWAEGIVKNKNNIFVYKVNNQILGIIRLGKAESLKNIGEVFVLYVKKKEKRKGIGSKLLKFAKNKFIEDGYGKMIIWCLKGNNQGANFYKKQGGYKLKERDYIVREINVREEGYIFNLKDENDIKLIKPTIEYKEQAKEMMDEARKYDANNPDIWAGYSSMQKYEHYEEWLEKLENDLDFENIKPGRVPASTYFLLRKKDNKILGIINIRYELNEYLENFGGHIGYSIRATERKKGYGKKQLELALDKCSEISINNVLITCREDNKGSAKVIEACGGIYEDTRFSKEENDNFKRYWIKY